MRTPIAVVGGLLTMQFVGARAEEISDQEAVALELSGELLAPTSLVDSVIVHLQSIRSVELVLEQVHCRLPWVPGTLLVQLTSAAWNEYEAGAYSGLDSLNALYGPVTIDAEYPSIRVIVLDFVAHYNAALLSVVYEVAQGVSQVTPDYYGPTKTDIQADSLGTYTFRYGWLSCPLGCVYNHYWTYQIDESGAPLLVAEWGDPLVDVAAPEVFTVAKVEVDVRPNPLTNSTRITASVPSTARTTVTVVDVAGRHVRALRGAMTPEGFVRAEWDGRDHDGRPVPSGVYFVIVASDGGDTGRGKIVVRR